MRTRDNSRADRLASIIGRLLVASRSWDEVEREEIPFTFASTFPPGLVHTWGTCTVTLARFLATTAVPSAILMSGCSRDAHLYRFVRAQNARISRWYRRGYIFQKTHHYSTTRDASSTICNIWIYQRRELKYWLVIRRVGFAWAVTQLKLWICDSRKIPK